jgi:uncharacterized protein YbaP (TraB family)
MLWKIDGTPHRVLASVHALPADTYFPPWTNGCLRGVERIVFEADHHIPGAFASGIDSTRSHLSLPGASELYLRVGEYFSRNGIQLPLESYRPWFAALQISGPIMATLGLKMEFGVEEVLRALASQNSLSVAFLEEPTLIADLLNQACSDPAVGLRFLSGTLEESNAGFSLEGLRGIVAAWLAGELTYMEAVHQDRIDKYREIYSPLITSRNRHWVPVAKAMITEAVPTLFVVGALHTVGPDSFLELLKEQGIATTRGVSS